MRGSLPASLGRQPVLRRSAVQALAHVTRRFHPRGTDWLLRRLHNPDARHWWIDGVAPLDGGLQLHVSTRSFLEWRVFFYGDYEEDVQSLIRALVPPGGVAVDVGANVGVHTLVMWKATRRGSHEGTVVACEPNPRVLDRLRANLALNRSEGVVVCSVALLDREQPVELLVPSADEPNQATATLSEESPEIAFPSRVLVSGTTLDLLLERGGIRGVDLVKIDVEGFEEPVLVGARKTLERDRPNLVFEYAREHWKRSGHSLERVLAMLWDLGYRAVFHLDRRGLRALPSPPPPQTNIVALRDGHAPLTRPTGSCCRLDPYLRLPDSLSARQDGSETRCVG